MSAAVQVTTWELVTFLISLLGGMLTLLVGGAKYILAAIERQQRERFRQSERARAEASERWLERFASIENALNDKTDKLSRIEREFFEMKADLPTSYVRREDYIRGQTVIEAKIDALALRIENQRLLQLEQNR